MALKPNTATTFSMTLRVGGVPVAISEQATVTAQIYTADGGTALSALVPVSPDGIGADFSNGLLAIEFTASHTANITPPSVMIVVTVMDGGNSRTWRAVVSVDSDTPGASDERTQLFNRRTAVAMLRDELALSASGILPGADGLSDDFLWNKLVSAEAAALQRLKVFFTPTEVLPNDVPDAEVQALLTAGKRVYQEASYDYDPDFFMGERFGTIILKQKPIIAVHSIDFAYPDVDDKIFGVPKDWIRLDKKYGHIRLVPVSNNYALPLSAYLLQVFGGSRTIPFLLRIRYTAGLDASKPEWAHLHDAVRKMAILKILQSTFPAASGSISADGLSQSKSIQVKDWEESVDGTFKSLYDAIHGVRIAFLG